MTATLRQPIRTAVERVGQRYVDEPQFAYPSPERRSPVAVCVAAMFGRVLRWWDDEGRHQIDLADAPRLLLGYNHVPLRWMEPTGKGGLVPKA
jgi:hypothetical protein